VTGMSAIVIQIAVEFWPTTSATKSLTLDHPHKKAAVSDRQQ
jgi:hypothetical protein